MDISVVNRKGRSQQGHKAIIERRLAAMLGISAWAAVEMLIGQIPRLAQMLNIAKMPDFVIGFKNRRGGHIAESENDVKQQNPLDGT